MARDPGRCRTRTARAWRSWSARGEQLRRHEAEAAKSRASTTIVTTGRYWPMASASSSGQEPARLRAAQVAPVQHPAGMRKSNPETIVARRPADGVAEVAAQDDRHDGLVGVGLRRGGRPAGLGLLLDDALDLDEGVVRWVLEPQERARDLVPDAVPAARVVGQLGLAAGLEGVHGDVVGGSLEPELLVGDLDEVLVDRGLGLAEGGVGLRRGSSRRRARRPAPPRAASISSSSSSWSSSGGGRSEVSSSWAFSRSASARPSSACRRARTRPPRPPSAGPRRACRWCRRPTR